MNQQDKKMMQIEIDEDIYAYLATQTESIGESASSILRRLLNLELPTEMTASNPSNSNITSISEKNKTLKKNNSYRKKTTYSFKKYR